VRNEIPGYRLIEPISFGAMAVVYRGVQASLDRPVAIKVLPPGHPSAADAYQRFEREARAIASLSHPNLVQIIDFVEADGGHYLVMEFVSGFDLGKVMELRGRLGIDEALAVACVAAEALWFAHARGIVHRDIKPRNILLSRSGQVKIVDFGVAQVMEGEERSTASGFVGTPAYVAPEQILGKRVDGRADVFSLGVVLYEMLTGVKPFRNDPESNVVSKILEEEPVPPRTLNKRVGRAAQKLILRCLEKDPARRFGDMQELLKALRGEMSPAERFAPRAVARLALSLFGPDSDQAITLREPLASGPFPERVKKRLAKPSLRRASLIGTVGALAGLGAVLLLAQGDGDGSDAARAAAAAEEAGFLEVVAYPWADVLVDGRHVETTPFDRALRLAAGSHQVRLRHPDLPPYETTLRVPPGSFQRLRVDLTGRGRFEEAAR